jgi:hypothetical protein
MSERASSQVVIRLDQRLFYAFVAIFGVLALFGVGLYIGRLSSGASRAAAPAPVAANQTAPLALQQPQMGAQVANPVTSGQTGGQNPFQTQPGQQVQAAAQPFGQDNRLSIPEIKDKGYVWDFGSVPPTAKVEKVFQLKNDGKSELIIEDVTSSCGCTAAIVNEDKVKPGAAAELRVGYDPRVNKDQGKTITRQVRVKYHFADEPGASKTAEFTIRADVTQ